MMLEFLQTGKAIYVLAAICLIGMVGRLAARNLYKGLIRETDNMMTTRNRWLRQLRQRAEDVYRINQGKLNTQVFVEKQLYEARMGLFSPDGWQSLAGQMTALCFLVGGGASFLSYWYRCDSYYIVLYSSVGLLAGIFNLMLDYGVRLEELRLRLSVSIRDYLENSLWKRLGRDRLSASETADAGAETGKGDRERITSGRDRITSGRAGAGVSQTGRAGVGTSQPGRAGTGSGMAGKSEGGAALFEAGERTAQKGGREGGLRLLRGRHNGPRLLEPEDVEAGPETGRGTEAFDPRRGGSDALDLRRGGSEAPDPGRMSAEALSQLKESLAQTAASALSRGNNPPTRTIDTSAGESWLKELKPEEIKVLGEIIREYLGE